MEQKCEYCHNDVSIYESFCEFGKHYHERCYIHKTQKEIEQQYKKKWINYTLTDGDKIDLIDKFNLVQKLKAETTEFKGFKPVRELKSERRVMEKRILWDKDRGQYIKDQEGHPIIIESTEIIGSITTLKTRPDISRTRARAKVQELTVADIPRLMEGL